MYLLVGCKIQFLRKVKKLVLCNKVLENIMINNVKVFVLLKEIQTFHVKYISISSINLFYLFYGDKML